MSPKAQHIVLSEKDLQTFNTDGYLVLRNFTQDELLSTMREEAKRQIATPSHPMELEAITGYPGAPNTTQETGGKTVRRFLGAYQRHSLWQLWASNPTLVRYLKQLLNDKDIALSQAHHNCLMTKSPEYSSDTGWHQDIRYWSFTYPYLVNMWLALGEENENNGGLVVVPGSHNITFTRSQFDEKLFFRDDIEPNKTLLTQAKDITLHPGDILFFHCRLLHKASRNHTEKTKLSLVFTYHNSHNSPITNSRSASIPSIPL